MLFLILAGTPSLSAQSATYEHILRPAFWYNTTDGIQLGVRYFGYQYHPENDKYRIYSGFWVNTKLPDNPVSYDLRLEHPLALTRAPQEPLTLGLHSRFRDGLHRHGGFIEKRLETGHTDDQFLRLTAGATYYHQIDSEYLVFPVNWSGSANTTLSGKAYFRNGIENRYQTAWTNIVASVTNSDIVLEVGSSWYERLNTYLAIGIKLGSRIHSSANGAPEWSTNLAYQSAALWNDKSFFRSHGTLPVAALQTGSIVSSGTMPSLRGYSRHDTERFQASDIHAVRALYGVSAELEIANPLDLYLRKMPIAGVFTHFKTRLFADAALVDYRDSAVIITNKYIANAGIGILAYFNLPDYLAAERGFAIRWDVPFWVSDPFGTQNNFAFRNQLSFDIIIPF